ncbi:MAG: hypothetical protein JWN37_406 [Candidatus Nomurabacteria bacterium]|nr:hypothetical protein [Candidatus Nomurabacteria bacterium]
MKKAYKKIIFFDGDGTIWYPKKTKRTVEPHLIYKDVSIRDNNHHLHLMLTPKVIETLQELKRRGVLIVLVSTYPHQKKEADLILNKKVKHFNLEKVFDGIYTARDYQEGKGEIIMNVLKKYKLPKARAVILGDSYRRDYLSAKRIGVDAYLIETIYMKGRPRANNEKYIIKEVEDLLNII